MELDTTPVPEYVSGFNEGYAIAKIFPELASQLAAKLGPSEHTEGFNDGRAEWLWEKEKLIDKSAEQTKGPKWMQPDRLNTVSLNQKSKEKGRELDKD